MFRASGLKRVLGILAQGTSCAQPAMGRRDCDVHS